MGPFGKDGSVLLFHSAPLLPLFMLLLPFQVGGNEGKINRAKVLLLKSCSLVLLSQPGTSKVHIVGSFRDLGGVNMALLSAPGDALGVISSHKPLPAMPITA